MLDPVYTAKAMPAFWRSALRTASKDRSCLFTATSRATGGNSNFAIHSKIAMTKHGRKSSARLDQRLASLRDVVAGPADPDDRELFRQIAAQVADRRSAWGISQRELAELCGTTQSAIARVERGARPPRIDTLARIAAALDCELTIELRPRTSPPEGGKEAQDEQEQA